MCMMGDYPVKLNTFGILDRVIASSLNLTVTHRDKLEINHTTGKNWRNICIAPSMECVQPSNTPHSPHVISHDVRGACQV